MIKPRKKLVIAFSLILISAAIVGTASYAWFTMNDKVSSGMDIQAVAAKNLVISETTDGPYSTSVDLSDTGVTKSLAPCSTADCANWYVPEGDTGIDIETGVISGMTPFSKLTSTTGYVRTGTVYVKVAEDSADAGFSALYVSGISVRRDDANMSDITNTLRIGVVCGSNVLIFDYSSIYGSVLTDVVSGIDGSGYALLTSLNSNSAGSSATAKLADTISSDPTRIDIYLWYEGQDSECTSNNSTTIENINVSIEFRGER